MPTLIKIPHVYEIKIIYIIFLKAQGDILLFTNYLTVNNMKSINAEKQIFLKLCIKYRIWLLFLYAAKFFI